MNTENVWGFVIVLKECMDGINKMSYIQDQITYGQLHKTERDVLEYLFCVLGNGIDLNLKGHIESYSDAEFIITEPVLPLKRIYPITKSSTYNYHAKLAGCSNKGFKEAVQYLIDCIMITSNDVPHIQDWKNNIRVLEELRDHLPIVDKYSDKNTGEEEFLKELMRSNVTTASRCNLKGVPNSSVRKVHLFDVQWSDTPEFVLEEVKQMWCDYNLSNDNYIYKTNLDNNLFKTYPRIYFWLKHKKVKEDEEVIIHWWW